jgi:hypothetical protein
VVGKQVNKFFDREFIFKMLRREEQYSKLGDGDRKESVLPDSRIMPCRR